MNVPGSCRVAILGGPLTLHARIWNRLAGKIAISWPLGRKVCRPPELAVAVRLIILPDRYSGRVG